jgi:hypothetical protein
MKFLVRVMLLLSFLLFTLPTVAQTEEAPAQVETESPDVIVVEQPADDGTVVTSIWTIISVLVFGLLTGGVFGVGAVWAAVKRASRSDEFMKSLEYLYNSRPDDQRTLLRTGVVELREGVGILEEVTDSIPYADKPKPSATPLRPSPE